MVEIIRLNEATDAAARDISLLLPQLRAAQSEHAATLEELRAVTSDKNVAFVVAMDGERIVGMATLYMITKFSKRSRTVEDVVVDSAYRGQGIGEKIMRMIIDIARTEGLAALHLTSRPDRVAAHKLYEKLGFTIKETDVFKLAL